MLCSKKAHRLVGVRSTSISRKLAVFRSTMLLMWHIKCQFISEKASFQQDTYRFVYQALFCLNYCACVPSKFFIFFLLFSPPITVDHGCLAKATPHFSAVSQFFLVVGVKECYSEADIHMLFLFLIYYLLKLCDLKAKPMWVRLLVLTRNVPVFLTDEQVWMYAWKLHVETV